MSRSKHATMTNKTAELRSSCHKRELHVFADICWFSPNLASWRHCEKLIFVDGVLCTLPWTGWLGSLLESRVCLHIEADNYQTRSRQQRHKSCIDFLTAGRLQGMVPLPAHPAHPDPLLITPERQDDLFHNKMRNWLLSAPVNWT